jgi:uncharacterized membrane protein YbhN (UPF0104 family)
MFDSLFAKRPEVAEFLRQNGRSIGAAISVLGLAGFAYTFSRNLSPSEAGEMLRLHWMVLLLALGLYLITYVLMSTAWFVLARGCGARIGYRLLAWAYLVSQIGKYLPGNVGHLLGRAFLARNRGVPVDVSGIAMSLELTGVLAAGALFATMAGILGPTSGDFSAVPIAAAVLALVLLAAVLFVSRRRLGGRPSLTRPFAVALACYLPVFALLAAANTILLGAASGPLILQVAAAVVLSWLVGFMVPGAPAGLGLREMSFYALLAGSFPGPTVLFAAAGMRLVTLTGDGIAWFVGLALGHFARDVIPSPVPG